MEGIKVNTESDKWPDKELREDLKELEDYMSQRLADRIIETTNGWLMKDGCSEDLEHDKPE